MYPTIGLGPVRSFWLFLRAGKPRLAPRRASPTTVPPMATIPDIADNEKWIMQTSLEERYGRAMEIQLGDADVRENSVPPQGLGGE